MSSEGHQGTFEDILSIASPTLRPVCEGLRKLILALHPTATEVVWPRLKIASYGFGPHKNTEHYAFIALHPRHINLGFYYGVSLEDPHGLLEGSGKNLRHIKVPEAIVIGKPEVSALLRKAINERKGKAPDA